MPKQADIGAPSHNDLATRLAARGISLPGLNDVGRECGPREPAKLQDKDGSLLVRGQLQTFLAELLMSRTVPDLREICRCCSLPTNGSKEDLVKRLAPGGCSAGRPLKRRRSSISSPPPRDENEGEPEIEGTLTKVASEGVCRKKRLLSDSNTV